MAKLQMDSSVIGCERQAVLQAERSVHAEVSEGGQRRGGDRNPFSIADGNKLVAHREKE